MDGVLEGAVVLCVCKLVCSLLFLPSLTASYSPVSYCCCCLLIFTDFLVTVFLSFLYIFEPWLTELTTRGDIIALRFLLFLNYTYSGVLLLVMPLIAVETLSRLLWPHCIVPHGVAGQTMDSDGQHCYFGQVIMDKEEEKEKEEEDSNNPYRDKGLSHVVSYLCCLSVWVVVALNVRWQGRLEEEWADACLHETNSLIRCLPNLFSPMPGIVNPCWGMAFLFLLLLLLTISSSLRRQHQAPAHMVGTHKEKHGRNNNYYSCWQNQVADNSASSKLMNPGVLVSETAQCVDPEKTESSCTVHRAYSWNIVQMSADHHGDFVLISPGCLSAEMGGQEHERTKRGGPHQPGIGYGSLKGELSDSLMDASPQRLHVLAVGVALTRAEVGEDLGGEFLSVGVEPGHVVRVVEDEQAFRVVQVHPHLLQLALDIEAGPGLGAGTVLVPVVHDDAVEAATGLDLDAALATDCLVGHADHPLGLLRHHHLPVMDARGEALGAQNRYLHIKAARGVLQRLRVKIPVGHN
ncbi:hypothetical protein INR49_029757, partial [Caranx melampygus]